MSKSASLNIDNKSARLEGVLDFTTVVAVQEEGERWLRDTAPEDCCFDLSGVSECNSAATALLLDWLRIGASLNKKITIVNVPQRLRDLMRLAGLEDVLAEEVFVKKSL